MCQFSWDSPGFMSFKDLQLIQQTHQLFKPVLNSTTYFGLEGHHHIDHEYKSMYSHTEI
jgi:hypothetical protein